MGVINSVVFEIVAGASHPLTTAEVHGAVESVLATSVSRSTTKDALARMAADPASSVVRVALGLYGLDRPTQ